MSDSLIIEFYEGASASDPVLSVLARHGGDSPDSAAETLADFFLEVGELPYIDWQDMGALATRFILRQQCLHYGASELSLLGAVPVPPKTTYGLQVVRIRGRKQGPTVEFVEDSYTKREEIAVAKYILEKVPVEVLVSPR